MLLGAPDADEAEVIRFPPLWPASRVVPWLVLAALLVGTAGVYRGALRNGFVWDDTHTVANNPAIRSLSAAGRWFASPDATSTLRENNYRPVLVTSYAVDYALWGRFPSGYHATNLLIHLGVVAAVFALGRRLWRDAPSALCAAAIVALHPLNAEAVNYVSARSSSLSALFALAALFAYDAVSRDEGDRRWGLGRGAGLGSALLLGLAALGTKETAVILPLLVVAWDRMRFGERHGWLVTLARSLPWWALVALWLAARGAVLGDAPRAAWVGDGPWQAGLFAAKIYASSIGHWLWPAGLAIDHGWPPVIGGREAALVIAALCVAAVATWGVFRLDRRWGWCLAWFWAALLPVVALPWVSRLTLYQDHRVYLAGVGLAWLAGRAAVGARAVIRRPMARVATTIAAAVLVSGVALADARRTAVWKDSDRLWEDVVERYPKSVLAQNHIGVSLLQQSRIEDARRVLERSVGLAPHFAPSHNYLGIALASLGERARAIAEFETALALDPNYAIARLNLGNSHEQAGRLDLALEAYEKGFPDGPWARDTLERAARVLERQGRFDDALDRSRRIVAVDPDDEAARVALGARLLRARRWAEARAVFAALVARRPDSYPVRFNLGVALQALDLPDEALEAFQAAAVLQPNDPDPHVRIATIHAWRGQWADAAAAYEQALARDPRHAVSHFNLGLVAERLGDRGRAVSHYRAAAASEPSGSGGASLRGEAMAAIDRLGGGRVR